MSPSASALTGATTLLERLLRNLALQRTAGLFDYSIVVVDNDAGGHARDTVARIHRN